MNGIFVDTGAWYALVDSDDADHKAAAAFLASNTMPLITTNFIFSETVTLIRYRIGHEAARSFGQKLMESSFVRVVAVTTADEERAWEYFQQIPGSGFQLRGLHQLCCDGAHEAFHGLWF